MVRSEGFEALTYVRPELTAMRQTAEALLAQHATRRSVRHFSPDPIPLDVLDLCIRAAGLAPSGAHKQPWSFCVVTDPALKRKIRAAAEAEEQAFYTARAPQSWLDDLAVFGTDANKPFLETAPALVVLFAQNRGPDGSKHYYISESVGIAAGFFISALHRCGLVTLTHTPSPMGFLREICGRPDTEKPLMIIVVGHAAKGATVPDHAMRKKPLERIASWL